MSYRGSNLPTRIEYIFLLVTLSYRKLSIIAATTSALVGKEELVCNNRMYCTGRQSATHGEFRNLSHEVMQTEC